ncbi:MAG: outer membrane lipoprotein-sorting protein [Nitrospinota bacterium]
MKKFSQKNILILLFLLPLLLHPAFSEASPPINRGEEILNKLDDMFRGESSHSIILMKIKTAHYERSMEMEGWSKGKEKSLITILKPLKEKGTTTLKSDNNIFTYLPKTDRTIRITSGMMMGSWMGSHLTNDDLVKESRMSEDYESTISFEGNRDGKDIIEITLIPRPEAPVVWGKIIVEVMADSYLPINERYYSEDMELERSMHFKSIKNIGGRRIPTIFRVVPADKPGEYTEITYQKIEFDMKLDEALFSISSLRKKN